MRPWHWPITGCTCSSLPPVWACPLIDQVNHIKWSTLTLWLWCLQSLILIISFLDIFVILNILHSSLCAQDLSLKRKSKISNSQPPIWTFATTFELQSTQRLHFLYFKYAQLVVNEFTNRKCLITTLPYRNQAIQLKTKQPKKVFSCMQKCLLKSKKLPTFPL